VFHHERPPLARKVARSPIDHVLFDAALQAAMRHVFRYAGYETPEKACKAIRRRCKGHTPEEYLTAFEVGLDCWRAVQKDMSERATVLLGRFPQFSGASIVESFSWAAYWLGR
jgi:hypothetical protein